MIVDVRQLKMFFHFLEMNKSMTEDDKRLRSFAIRNPRDKMIKLVRYKVKKMLCLEGIG